MDKNSIELYLDKHAYKKNNGVFIFGIDHSSLISFEEHYLSLREKEQRVFKIELVQNLPILPKNHPLYSEWKLRAENAIRFKKYLIDFSKSNFSKDKPGVLLDLGCGNGWFSNFLAEIPNLLFLGVDVNFLELKQASASKKHLDQIYIYADITESKILPLKIVDLVVLNSSFQYFGDFESLFVNLEKYLSPKFEIHIMDTMFYFPNDILAAKKRSHKYFKKQGATSIISYYHHHTFDQFHNFNVSNMFDPTSLRNKLMKLIKPISPFYWFRITKNE